MNKQHYYNKQTNSILTQATNSKYNILATKVNNITNTKPQVKRNTQ